jgi:BetI-type transcriptional repressor, C-terminal
MEAKCPSTLTTKFGVTRSPQSRPSCSLNRVCAGCHSGASPTSSAGQQPSSRTTTRRSRSSSTISRCASPTLGTRSSESWKPESTIRPTVCGRSLHGCCHSPKGVVGRSARVVLLADQLAGREHRRVFEANQQRVRRYLRAHLSELLDDDEDVDHAAELLSVVANGIVLSACEHPTTWPRRRQLRVLGLALSGLGLPSESTLKLVGRAPRAGELSPPAGSTDRQPSRG